MDFLYVHCNLQGFLLILGLWWMKETGLLEKFLAFEMKTASLASFQKYTIFERSERDCFFSWKEQIPCRKDIK